ncbi:MAG: sigma-E processing peptidase SpoIIGA [Oscillospiraceae bacterium]
MQTVYVDTLFFLNFVVNYLVLMCTAKICSLKIRRLRMALGAFVGGAYAVAVLFEALRFLSAAPVKIAVGILIALVVFGGEQKLFRITAVFFAVSAAFGGAVFAVSLIEGQGSGDGVLQPITFRVLALSACITYAALSLFFRRAARSKAGDGGVSKVEVKLGNKKTIFTALRDTGNSLNDPMTGRQIIVADFSALRDLFPKEACTALTPEKLRDPVKAFETVSAILPDLKFRLVPYRAVGTGGGVLLAVKTDETVIEGKNVGSCLIAISPDPVSDGGAYAALCGGTV